MRLWVHCRPRTRQEFFNEFGPFLQEGAVSHPEHKNQLAKLLRFESSALEPGEKTSFDEYMARVGGMPPRVDAFSLSWFSHPLIPRLLVYTLTSLRTTHFTPSPTPSLPHSLPSRTYLRARSKTVKFTIFPRLIASWR